KALEEAKKEIATVDGRRSRVTITVVGSTVARVTLDGGPVKSEALGVPLFVNPGTHTVTAAADGFNPANRTFAVGEGQSEPVALALEAAAAVAVAPAAPARVAPVPPVTHDRHVNHVPAFVAFGVGGVGLIAGVVEGLAAMAKHNTLKKDCQTST